MSLGLFLPFEAVLAQLVMGESSYVLGVALMLAVVVWGSATRTDDPPGRERRFLGPFLYALVLVVLLHSRIHVVPIAGGVCLALFCRDGFRSWPWWVASIIAGLLRIPLWVRWRAGQLRLPGHAWTGVEIRELDLFRAPRSPSSSASSC